MQFAYYGTVMASSQLISKTGSVSLLGGESYLFKFNLFHTIPKPSWWWLSDINFIDDTSLEFFPIRPSLFENQGSYSNEKVSIIISLFTDSSWNKYSCSLNCVRFSQHDLADLGITAVAELIGLISVVCKSIHT